MCLTRNFVVCNCVCLCACSHVCDLVVVVIVVVVVVGDVGVVAVDAIVDDGVTTVVVL